MLRDEAVCCETRAGRPTLSRLVLSFFALASELRYACDEERVVVVAIFGRGYLADPVKPPVLFWRSHRRSWSFMLGDSHSLGIDWINVIAHRGPIAKVARET
jgi:hypothetical protein